jgi:hypothetical protein
VIPMQTRAEILANNAGVVACRRNRTTTLLVTLYDAAVAGIDADGDPLVVVCEAHGALLNAQSKTWGFRAMAQPWDFCEECRSLVWGTRPH